MKDVNKEIRRIEKELKEVEKYRKLSFWRILWTSILMSVIATVIIVIGLFLYFNIIAPSYMSLNPELLQNGTVNSSTNTYYLGGFYVPSKDKIYVLMNITDGNLNYKKINESNLYLLNATWQKGIYIHEVCHREQHFENRNYTGKGRILNEIECYWKENVYIIKSAFHNR